MSMFGRDLYAFVGLSTDSNSPTVDPSALTWAQFNKPILGQLATETDSLTTYRWNGASWVESITSDKNGNESTRVIVSEGQVFKPLSPP